MDILYDTWSPAMCITAVLLCVFSMLTDANPDNPINREAAELYFRDRAKYNATARAWVQRYADPDVAFMRLSFPDCLNGIRRNACHLPSSPVASCSRPSSFARKSCACSTSSNTTSGFLRITVGSKRCRPSAALSWNVLRVGECASCSPVWRSRASDWSPRLPVCT